MNIEDVRRRVFPEVEAGGFSDNDGSILFYSRLNALVNEDSVVLDYGAGRGVGKLTDPCMYRRRLRILRGRVRKLVGCDIDPVVTKNTFLDEAHLVVVGEPLPFEDGEFDVILSDYVFEHVADPLPVVMELGRVLRPGGWLLARTTNKYGYVGLATKLIPPALRRSVLRLLNPNAGGADNFPVTLNMNTLSRIRHLFPSSEFVDYSYCRRFEGLGYFGRSVFLLRFMRILMHFIPIRFGPEIIIVLRKL
jgi:SAM-dependent methyltransferase